MKFLIVALPLFNKDMAVEAYKMHMREGEKLFGTSHNHTFLDGAMNSSELEILSKIGLDAFTGGKPIFINVTKFMLLADIKSQCSVPCDKIVLTIDQSVTEDASYVEICNAVKEHGFKLALENVPYTRQNRPFFKIADYIIIDSMNKSRMEEIRFIFYDTPKVMIILKNIVSKEEFDVLKSYSNSLYEGKFYNEPITKGATTVSPLKTNLMHLLKIAGDEDFDLNEVASVIQRDTSLTISMLKFINSAASGSRNKINSIKNAIAFLGQKEVRKWIMVAVSTKLAADKPNEITKLSLVRAKFAENLSKYFEMAILSPSLFLLGLFSMLDVILELPMEKAVKEIFVNDMISDALVKKSGKLYVVLELIIAYERADWEKVAYLMVLNEINPSDISECFIDALEWYKELLENIS